MHAGSRGAQAPFSAGVWDMDVLPVRSQGRPSSLALTAQGKPRLDSSTPELMSVPSPCPHPMERSPEG